MLRVQGRTDAEVTITNIGFEAKRAPAFAGTRVSLNCARYATEAPVRRVYVDLDKESPEVTAFYTWDPKNGKPREIRFPYNPKVSKSEADTFFLAPHTEDCDCTWTGHVDWVSQGRKGSLPIDNNGAPFRIATPKLADHVCESKMGTGSWDCKP